MQFICHNMFHLKYTLQWFLVYSELHKHHHNVVLEYFQHPPHKETSYPLAVISYSLPTPILNKYKPMFNPYGFGISLTMWLFVFGIFPLTIFLKFIYFVAILHSFLRLNYIPLYGCTTFWLSIHSLVNGHLGCFYFGTVMSKMLTNVHVQVFVRRSCLLK